MAKHTLVLDTNVIVASKYRLDSTCKTLGMDLGNHIRPASSAAPAEWIGPLCDGAAGTVGAIVPNHYESFLHVHPPARSPSRHWLLTYRDLYAAVAAVGERHTAEWERAWFAVWIGRGFDTSTPHIVWAEPPRNDVEQSARHAKRIQLLNESRRQQLSFNRALEESPTFERGDRRYYLLEGAMPSVTQLQRPSADRWYNPDLFWPNDRRWFVATDVDFPSLFVGGDRAFIADLARSIPTRSEIVRLDSPTPPED